MKSGYGRIGKPQIATASHHHLPGDSQAYTLPRLLGCEERDKYLSCHFCRYWLPVVAYKHLHCRGIVLLAAIA